MDNFAPTAERVGDSALYVEFYSEAFQSMYKSEAAGHPVFDDFEMIRIQTPGDSKTIIETKVDETHKRRFPVQYARYKAGETNKVSGWTLKEWPAVTMSQVKTLNYHNVFTVEQLSSISDQSCSNIGMGMFELRNKARAALEVAEGNAEREAKAANEVRMQNEIDSLKAQLQAVNAQAQEKRGPGRPAKE